MSCIHNATVKREGNHSNHILHCAKQRCHVCLSPLLLSLIWHIHFKVSRAGNSGHLACPQQWKNPTQWLIVLQRNIVQEMHHTCTHSYSYCYPVNGACCSCFKTGTHTVRPDYFFHFVTAWVGEKWSVSNPHLS